MPLELVIAFSWEDNWLAIAGLVVAVIGSAVSIRVSVAAHRRAGRAEAASQRAEDRDRERIEREREAVAANRRARLELITHETGDQYGRHIARVSVRNFGPAVANDVRVWLVEPHRNVAASELAGGDITLGVDQESDRLDVLVNEDITEELLPMLRWFVEWTDDEEELHQQDARRRPPGSEPPDPPMFSFG